MADFTPQQIEQFLQEFFDVVGTRQYTGARYVPIFGRAGSDTVEWDDLEPYEPLTVVMHEGVSYVSRRYVPRGIQITDTAYWVQTYRFNAQVEAYRQEVLSFQGQIDEIREDFVPFPDELTLPKYGTLGQVLTTLEDGKTKWEDPVVPSDQQAEEVITAWLDAHPEATTTVQDNSLTTAKYQDGSVTPAKTSNEVMGFRQRLADGTDLNTIVDTGYYSIASNADMVNKPSGATRATAELFVYRNVYSGPNVTLQFYVMHTGSANNFAVWVRAINNGSGTVIPSYDWLPIIGTIRDNLGDSRYNTVSQNLVKTVYDGGMKRLGALSQNTDLNTLTENGFYNIPSYTMPTLINKPTDVVSGTGSIITLVGLFGSGVSITTQYFLNYNGTNYALYVRALSNGSVLSGYDWQLVSAKIMQTTGNYENRLMSQKAITDAINERTVSNAFLTLRNKSVVVFGDSRTWYDGHAYGETTKSEWRGQTCVGYQQTAQPIVQSDTWVNMGVSGDTTVQICDRIKAYDFANTDVLIIAGGVNDFVKSSQVTIGSIAPIGGTFDTTTVYGDLQSAIEQVLAARPSMRIYVIVPAIAWVGGSVFPYATAKARKDVAELYHLPYLDLYSLGGINEVNRGYFYCDDPALTNDWYLHFNDYGNAWIGSIVGKWLNSV